MSGKVILIGAGPGDPGLMTQKAVRELAQAEVVLYDRLVGDGVLAMMPEGAELINVGKNAGNHPVPQEEISRLLLEKALEGKRVVRLKGGDCFLFGRGGEELEPLTEHGVPFEVVPGVPSPIAATAYAGIPVTHRDYCSSVHFITGHRRQDGALTLDYASLVRLDGTLVFLMSVASCREIAAGLMTAGMSGEMPAAVIENGTRPEQRKFVTVLAQLGDTVTENRVISPALIVVGKVCSLSDRFDWFSRLPLHGRKILSASPLGSAGKLKAGLDALGARVDVLPVLRREAISFDLPEPGSFDVLAFASIAGVERYFDALLARGLDARSLGGVTVGAVGAVTAGKLEEYGVLADVTPDEYSGAALARALLEGGSVRSGTRVVLPCAEEYTPELGDLLAQAGALVRRIVTYRAAPSEPLAVDPAQYDWVTFTSASCVRSFLACCGASGFTEFARVRALCIGEKTAAAARRAGMDVSVSKEATIAGMIEFLKEAHDD